jgi:hypothetical protein
VVVPTPLVVTVNVALVAPAAMVTLAGTVAEVLLLVNVTTAPLAGAALPNVTVPVADAPPISVVGLSDTDESVAGLMVRMAPWVALYVAEIVTWVDVATAVVVNAKVALVAPAATVTLAGTVAEGSLLVSVTTAPPVGAAPFSVTVPVEDAPPSTVEGLKETEESVDGFTVNVVPCVVL